MLTKLLLTILVIVAVLTFARQRGAARPNIAGEAVPAPQFRRLPYILLVTAILVSGLLAWMHWRDAHRIFTARVTDTRTGEVRLYPVYPGDVHGRTFKTVDGRLETLADVERLELVEGTPPKRVHP